MNEFDWAQLIQNAGPLVVIAAVFIWDGRAREKRMSDRLDSVQGEQAARLASVVERNTEAFTKFAEAVRDCPAKGGRK